MVSKLNPQLSKFLFYYPVTFLKGEFVGRYLKHYRQQQSMSPEQLHDYQTERLRRLLGFAKKNSPYYAERLAGVAIEKTDIWQVLKNIPVTQKSDLISRQQDMVCLRGPWISAKTTGGSTGEPVKILKNPSALARERAATWRAYEWAGVTVGDSQGRFWGIPHSAADSRKARVIDFVANRMRISAFNLTDASLNVYYARLSQFKPSYLYGYASVLETFAQFVSAQGLPPLSGLKSVISTSEVLTDAARTSIQAAFAVPVFNEYGCGEVGSVAHECEAGSMHLMADNMVVETLSGEQSGELVVTDLFNYAQPMIKYSLGDFATLSEQTCTCGRTLPLIEKVHGRAYDMVVLDSGKQIHPEALMYIFEDIQKKLPAFSKFQVIQNEINQFLVNIIPTENWTSDLQQALVQQIKQVVGASAQIRVAEVTELAREKSGKMRVIKSHVTK